MLGSLPPKLRRRWRSLWPPKRQANSSPVALDAGEPTARVKRKMMVPRAAQKVIEESQVTVDAETPPVRIGKELVTSAAAL
jgi:hypothetical protein